VPTIAFGYVRPDTLDSALEMLDQDGARPIAGGQSLVPMLNLRLVRPAMLVDVNAVLRGPITTEAGVVRIPASTTHHEIATAPAILRHCPALASAARQIGNVRVRLRGTIGGSLAHADPASEYATALIALGARVTVRGRAGIRVIPAEDFLVGYFTTELRQGELVLGVDLPLGRRQAFAEFAPRSSDFPIVLAAACAPSGGGDVFRLAIGGLGETVRTVEVRMPARGVHAAVSAARHAVSSLVSSGEVVDDHRASAWYRGELARVIGMQVLMTSALK
jgi:aerobic carbon-monoxide dehydrogenase medium subunit